MPTPHHDHSYKRLFSHPEMVRDLLAGFVPQPWVAQADLGTLEPVKGSFVTDDFREREDDIIWRVRLADGWLYIYLLLELQSGIDRFMAVRIAAYLALLYQDLIEQKRLTPNGLLPPANTPGQTTNRRADFADVEMRLFDMRPYLDYLEFASLAEGALSCGRRWY
jgi:hypothetical protein